MVRVTCIVWRRLFHLQEPISKELCVEFFTTTKFRKREEVDNIVKFTFCLGGRSQECILVELAWRLDLYNQSEAMSERFPIFIDNCYMNLPQGIDEAEW